MKALLPAVAFAGLLGSADAALVISEIDLVNNKIEIVNTGTAAESLTGYWFCNLWQGSPVYVQITAAMIVGSESSVSTLAMPGGSLITIQSTAAFVTDLRGEMGLYRNADNFGDAANMVDYLAWGGDAIRDATAATLGIWGTGTSVNVTGITTGQTIQLNYLEDGNGFADYILSPSTIGFNQVPEPASAALAAAGSLLFLRRRRC